MAKILGVGGIFMTCADAAATRDWYGRVLGIEPDEYGGFSFLHSGSAAAFPAGARTIFGTFDTGTDYFAPSSLPFMINLIVDDLDGMLDRVAREGVAQVQPMQSFDYGRFAWIMDPDGRKIELWEPVG
jgi:predicted enzyme related to lactoylglutathione lyase